MLAVFHKNIFMGIWQDQIADPNWAATTALALGVSVNELEIYDCPAIRSDRDFYINDEKKLVLQEDPALYPDDAEPGEIIWAAPITLEKIF